MTIRWITGKKPTKQDIKNVVSNALNRPMGETELEAVAAAVQKFYSDRVERIS